MEITTSNIYNHIRHLSINKRMNIGFRAFLYGSKKAFPLRECFFIECKSLDYDFIFETLYVLPSAAASTTVVSFSGV